MTDYFDSCLFTDTVSFAKVEQVVKMVVVSMRIHLEPENTDESFHFFIFCGGVVQFRLSTPRFEVSRSHTIRHTHIHTR